MAQPKNTAVGPTAGLKRKRDDEDTSLSPWAGLTKVLVGKKEKLFLVHTHILCRVPFFRGCLDAYMIERREGVVKLPEDDPRAFSHAAHWMYHEKLPFDDQQRCDEHEHSKPSFTRHGILKLYVLAQKLLMEGLQNHVMDMMLGLLWDIGLSGLCCRLIYDELPEEDMMCKLLRQHMANRINLRGGWLAWKQMSKEQYSMFAALKLEYMEFAADAVATYPDAECPSETGDPCDWHVHISTPKCK